MVENFENELFPLLNKLMNEKKIEDRNHPLIKCILSSLLNYMYTLNKKDLLIPSYYNSFYLKDYPVKRVGYYFI